MTLHAEKLRNIATLLSVEEGMEHSVAALREAAQHIDAMEVWVANAENSRQVARGTLAALRKQLQDLERQIDEDVKNAFASGFESALALKGDLPMG